MDIRHPLKDYDRSMIGYAMRRGLPAHALLTKADKLSRTCGDTVSVQTFSAESKQGVDELRGVVGRWLGL